ncbi:hypothetical protein FRC12_011722, partial [Ceratobasidium sp. 428]
MTDRRRVELEVKRQKLAELKKAREDRQKRDLARKEQDAKKPSSSVVHEEVENLIGQLMGMGDRDDLTPSSSMPGTPSGVLGHARLSGLNLDGLPISGRASRASNGES